MSTTPLTDEAAFHPVSDNHTYVVEAAFAEKLELKLQDLTRKLAEAEGRGCKLREALEKYGDHNAYCDTAIFPAPQVCSCGYTQALASSPPASPEPVKGLVEALEKIEAFEGQPVAIQDNGLFAVDECILLARKALAEFRAREGER